MSKLRETGIYITVLATFLAAYGGENLALPSFGLASIGTIVFTYSFIEGDKQNE